ncbi:MAG: phasin family protein, partial [Salinibacter sp.]
MTATNDKTSTGEREGFALKNLPEEVTGQAREIWLAGLGALQRLEQEGDKVFETLVERGKEYEDKRRDQIEGATEQLRDRQKELTQNVTERLDDATKSVEKAVSDTLS